MTLGFFTTEMDFGCEIWSIAQERDRKAQSKKASFTFGRVLRLKHANRIPRPKAGVVSLVVREMPRLSQRGLITTLR